VKELTVNKLLPSIQLDRTIAKRLKTSLLTYNKIRLLRFYFQAHSHAIR